MIVREVVFSQSLNLLIVAFYLDGEFITKFLTSETKKYPYNDFTCQYFIYKVLYQELILTCN